MLDAPARVQVEPSRRVAAEKMIVAMMRREPHLSPEQIARRSLAIVDKAIRTGAIVIDPAMSSAR